MALRRSNSQRSSTQRQHCRRFFTRGVRRADDPGESRRHDSRGPRRRAAARKGTASDVNMHFHGLNVSPRRPADDVITMYAKSGRTLYYSVPIPATQPPGLYWYHTHIHGQTNIQVGQGGMSGAIVVEGITRARPRACEDAGTNSGRSASSATTAARLDDYDGGAEGRHGSMGSMEMPGAGPGPTTAERACGAPATSAITRPSIVNCGRLIRFTPGKPCSSASLMRPDTGIWILPSAGYPMTSWASTR